MVGRFILISILFLSTAACAQDMPPPGMSPMMAAEMQEATDRFEMNQQKFETYMDEQRVNPTMFKPFDPYAEEDSKPKDEDDDR